VANMIECRVEAKRQGDPTDPKVVEWILKHRPFKRTMSNGFEHGVMPKLTPGGLVPPKPTLRKLLLPDHML